MLLPSLPHKIVLLVRYGWVPLSCQENKLTPVFRAVINNRSYHVKACYLLCDRHGSQLFNCNLPLIANLQAKYHHSHFINEKTDAQNS